MNPKKKLIETVQRAKELKQLQDFRKIKVTLDYEGDDIKELEIDIEKLEELKENAKRKNKKVRNVEEEPESDDGASDFYSEDEYDSDKEKVVHKNSKISIEKAASGDFVVEEKPTNKKINIKRKKSS